MRATLVLGVAGRGWSVIPKKTENYQTNPISFKPAWKIGGNKAKNEANCRENNITAFATWAWRGRVFTPFRLRFASATLGFGLQSCGHHNFC
jgi:hypothetical protein